MLSPFDLLGVCLAAYTGWAAFTGAVFAKRGPWGRTVLREEESIYFWSVIAIYAGLSAVLILWF